MPTVPNGNYVFMGWSIDGISIIDISSYALIQNTIFIAVIDETPLVSFIVNNLEFSSYFSYFGANIILPDFELFYWEMLDESYEFLGWSADGINIDISIYAIIANTVDYTIIHEVTFIAVFDSITTTWEGTSPPQRLNTTTYPIIDLDGLIQIPVLCNAIEITVYNLDIVVVLEYGLETNFEV